MSKDIRLETMPFEYDGKTYVLRCNMNVLADVQDENDGNIAAALDERHPVKSVLSFLAAMMNDYADEMHWPERFTARQLGRNPPLSPTQSRRKPKTQTKKTDRAGESRH